MTDATNAAILRGLIAITEFAATKDEAANIAYSFAAGDSADTAQLLALTVGHVLQLAPDKTAGKKALEAMLGSMNNFAANL